MSTWGVLKVLFVCVFLMNINFSEEGCGEYIIDWMKETGSLEKSIFQVKLINSSGKVDVIHLLRTLCCKKQEEERDDYHLCNILRECKERREDCTSLDDADADVNTNTFHVMKINITALRCMIAEEFRFHNIKGCPNPNPNPYKNIGACMSMNNMTVILDIYNLTLEREHLILERNQRTQERDNIKNNLTVTLARYHNLTLERDNLTFERDNLTLERDKLTFERDNLTLERDNLTLEVNLLKTQGVHSTLKEPKAVAAVSVVSVFLVLSLILNAVLVVCLFMNHRRIPLHTFQPCETVQAVPLDEVVTTNRGDQNNTDDNDVNVSLSD